MSEQHKIGEQVGPTLFYAGRGHFDHVCAEPDCNGQHERCEPLPDDDARRVTFAMRRKVGLCPTCGVNRLSRFERVRGYQCQDCTKREEGF